MPEFNVQLMEGGALRARRIDAPDAQSVASVLRVPVLNIVSVQAVAVPRPVSLKLKREAFPLRLFSKELAVLLGAGIPLLEAIQTLREKEGVSTTAAALSTVEDRLRAGEAFSVALQACPEAFDALFVSVVASAERTGQLREALQSHTAYLAWAQTLRDRLIGASVYPVLLVLAGSAVVLFLLIYVVPRFAGLLDGVGGDVPAASRALLALGQWTGEHPWPAALMALALLASPLVAWAVPAVRERVLSAMWSVPLLAGRLRLLALARFYRTLSMLLGAGVPTVAALKTARSVVAPHLRQSVDAVTAHVDRGGRLSDALVEADLSTPVSLRMVRVGERSGSVGAMLGDAAAFYDEELSRITDLVTRLVSPLLMLVMGGVIGTVVVLMYLPIFQLMESVQ